MSDTLIEYGPNPGVTGKTLYARIASTSAQWWNGTAFEAYASGDYASYAVALSEQTPHGAGYFTGATPSALPAGTYNVVIQLQAGGSPAPSDTSPTGAGSCGFRGYWDGTGWHAGPAYVDALPSPPPTGYGPAQTSGTTAVSQSSGGAGRNPSDMTVEDSGSTPIQGCIVQAYLASAYTADPGSAEVLGATTTNALGQWALFLPTGAGTCTIVFTYLGDQTATGSVTV